MANIREFSVSKFDVEEIKRDRGYHTQLGEIRSNGSIKNHNDIICGCGIEYKLRKSLEEDGYNICYYPNGDFKSKDYKDLILFDYWSKTDSGKITNIDLFNLNGEEVDIKTITYVTNVVRDNKLTCVNVYKDYVLNDDIEFLIINDSLERIKKSNSKYYLFYYHKQNKFNNCYDYKFNGYVNKEYVINNYTESYVYTNFLNCKKEMKTGIWIKKSEIRTDDMWLHG